MAKLGKWIGGGLGWAFGGPIGAILGSAIDSSIYTDVERTDTQTSGRKRYYTSQPNDFAISLMVLVAAVMKADGRILKAELDFVKRFFKKQFGSEKTQQHLITLRDILKKDIPIEEVCVQIRTFTVMSARIQLLHLLFGVASADSDISQQELDVISRISAYLGIPTHDFNSIKAMFVKQKHSDYQILEIEATVSDDEVKKAYRRMAVKYHPDKVSHMGDEFQHAAKEKFQKVQEAYENIKKQRGIK